jgi:hypothetical protein
VRGGRLSRPLALALVILLSAADALACGCVDWPADRRMAEADRVFLARAKKRTASDELQHFDVLLWLKGEVHGADYAIQRADGDCERTFTTGELALVFEAHGKMPVCNGNVDLDAILPTLGDYLGGSTDGVPREALALALAGRVHGKATLYYPPLGNQTLETKGAHVAFSSMSADKLPVLTASTRGGLTHVTLRQPDGAFVWTLVGPDHGKFTVLATTTKPAPRR